MENTNSKNFSYGMKAMQVTLYWDMFKPTQNIHKLIHSSTYNCSNLSVTIVFG